MNRGQNGNKYHPGQMDFANARPSDKCEDTLTQNFGNASP